MFLDLLFIVLLTTVAGACIPLGGYLASFERILPNWLDKEFRHFSIALGGGILLGAVAFVLVPEGVASLNGSMMAIPVMFLGA